MVLPDNQTMLASSRSVADQVSLLGAALTSGDNARIDQALEGVLLTYDAYSSSAVLREDQFAFDDLAALPEEELRDQGSADALAGVLLDLEMASVLGETARLLDSDTIAAQDVQRLEALSLDLRQTTIALQQADALEAGLFAFGEVLAAAPEISPSQNLTQALEKFEAQATQIYQTLLEQTTGLLKLSFTEIDKIDLSKVSAGLKQVFGSMDFLAGVSGLACRALDALAWAIQGLQKLLGKDLAEKSESQLKTLLEKIKQGESPTQAFLKFSYGVETGSAKIKNWAKDSKADLVSVDAGTIQLAELHQRVIQAYAIHNRIVKSLRSLDDIFLWLLKKGGVGAPLDLLLYGVFLVIMDIAILQGMDYADTATLVKWVDGVLTISQRVLAG